MAKVPRYRIAILAPGGGESTPTCDFASGRDLKPGEAYAVVSLDAMQLPTRELLAAGWVLTPGASMGITGTPQIHHISYLGEGLEEYFPIRKGTPFRRVLELAVCPALRPYLVQFVKTEAQALLWASSYPRERSSVRDIVTSPARVLEWARAFSDDHTIMRDRITGSEYAFKWVEAFPREPHNTPLRDLVTEARWALKWALLRNSDRHHMLQFIRDPVYALEWAKKFPDDREYLRDFVVGDVDSIIGWASRFPQDRETMRKRIRGSRAAFCWAKEIGDRLLMAPLVTESKWAVSWAIELGDASVMRDRVRGQDCIDRWNQFLPDHRIG